MRSIAQQRAFRTAQLRGEGHSIEDARALAALEFKNRRQGQPRSASLLSRTPYTPIPFDMVYSVSLFLFFTAHSCGLI
jgi:hypothetical protein